MVGGIFLQFPILGSRCRAKRDRCNTPSFNSLYWVHLQSIEEGEFNREVPSIPYIGFCFLPQPAIKGWWETFNSLYWVRRKGGRICSPPLKSFNSLYWVRKICRWKTNLNGGIPSIPYIGFRKKRTAQSKGLKDIYLQFPILGSLISEVESQLKRGE